MKRLLIFLLSLLIACGCSRREPSIISDGNAVSVEIPGDITPSFLDIADNYSYVTLEMDDNIDAALGAITKLRVFRDRIYVLDNIFTMKLLIFDKNGSFIRKVSHSGRGDKEYIDISTFEINYLGEELFLQEHSGQKILVFDLDGNYKRTLYNDIRSRGMAVLADGYITHGAGLHWYGGPKETENYKLVVCDSDNKIIKTYIEDKQSYKRAFSAGAFMNPNFNGTVTFAPQFMNNIYRIVSADSIECIYTIKFDGAVERTEMAKHQDLYSFEGSNTSRKTIFLGDHAESEKYLYFKYLHNREDHHIYYRKEDGTARATMGGMSGQNITFDEHGNFWGSLSETDIIFAEQNEKTAELLEAVERSGNPLVICYTLKQ